MSPTAQLEAVNVDWTRSIQNRQGRGLSCEQNPNYFINPNYVGVRCPQPAAPSRHSADHHRLMKHSQHRPADAQRPQPQEVKVAQTLLVNGCCVYASIQLAVQVKTPPKVCAILHSIYTDPLNGRVNGCSLLKSTTSCLVLVALSRRWFHLHPVIKSTPTAQFSASSPLQMYPTTAESPVNF